ncbi:MAG: hypothetical protein JWN66_1655, partial [Sphingomonas bacterium]|nr:hypothetical protein [Sphingomonas bacterium]
MVEYKYWSVVVEDVADIGKAVLDQRRILGLSQTEL